MNGLSAFSERVLQKAVTYSSNLVSIDIDWSLKEVQSSHNLMQLLWEKMSHQCHRL